MDVNAITSGSLGSPAELIDLEESLNPCRPPDPLLDQRAFRGQSQAYGTLAPSFHRIFGQKQHVGAAQIIERDLIQTFRKHYVHVKGRTDDMPSPSSIDVGMELHCLSVMQHHGVPPLASRDTDDHTPVMLD